MQNDINISYIYANIADIYVYLYITYRFKSNKRSHSGDNGDEDPPVPIPNTEVKLVYAESTWHRAPGRIGNCFEDISLRLFYLFCRKIFALKRAGF